MQCRLGTAVAYLMREVVPWEFVQHLPCLPAHNGLSGLSSPTGAVLGLDGQDGVQALLGSVTLVAEDRRGYNSDAALSHTLLCTMRETHVMSAFGCRPKISGVSNRGSFSMDSMYSFTVLYIGME